MSSVYFVVLYYCEHIETFQPNILYMVSKHGRGAWLLDFLITIANFPRPWQEKIQHPEKPKVPIWTIATVMIWIHHSNHCGHMLIPTKFNGTNYPYWSKSMVHALIVKDKLAFSMTPFSPHKKQNNWHNMLFGIRATIWFYHRSLTQWSPI